MADETVKITDTKRADFISYVLEFYGEGGLYPMKPPPTLAEIGSALDLLLRHYRTADAAHPSGALPIEEELEFDSSSHNREIVRDIIKARRGKRAPLTTAEAAEGAIMGDLEYEAHVLAMIAAEDS